MSKQPDALMLAAGLEAVNTNNADSLLVQMAARSAAFELRRQHALIEEMREALESAVDEVHGTFPFEFLRGARAALAKAEAQQ